MATTARRWAWITAGAVVAVPTVLVIGSVLLSPRSSPAPCPGPPDVADGGLEWTCSTVGASSPLGTAAVVGLVLLALLLAVGALVAAVVALVRRDVAARSAWSAAGSEGAPPRTAVRSLMLWGAAVLTLGLLGAAVATSFAAGLLAAPPFRLPETLGGGVDDDSLRPGLAYLMGLVALLLQWLGALLVVGAGVGAVAVARASRKGPAPRVDAVV